MEKRAPSSIKKAIAILSLLSNEPFEYSIPAIAKETGINVTTIYRILYQLEEEDMVAMDAETKKYRIGPNAYHIGASYVYSNNYMRNLEELVLEISEIIKESVGITIRDKDRFISVIETEIHQAMKINDVPGRYFYPNKGCYAKCIMAYQDPAYIEQYLNTHTFEKLYPAVLTEKEELLAEYEKIRRLGYAESIDEYGIDIIGTGIPLFDSKGEIWGCIAVSFFREDGWEQKLEDIRNVFFSYKRRLESYLP